MKALDYVGLAIKLILVALGTLTATDATLLHLSTTALGSTMAGLGMAATAVKALQMNAAPPAAK